MQWAKQIQIAVAVATACALCQMFYGAPVKLTPAGLVFFTFMAVLVTAYIQEAIHRWLAHRRSPRMRGAAIARPGAIENGNDLTPPE